MIAGTLRSPGSSCGPTPAGTKNGCASSCTVTWAGPGQVPSYKLGERIWLQARDEAKARGGDTFSLKDFHTKALSLGAIGLDPLREALARF